MKADDFAKLTEQDAALKVGDTVFFRFTNCGHQNRVQVKITKINAKSVRGKSIARYRADLGDYPAGHEFKVPRITDITNWTFNNCVEPEYHAEEKVAAPVEYTVHCCANEGNNGGGAFDWYLTPTAADEDFALAVKFIGTAAKIFRFDMKTSLDPNNHANKHLITDELEQQFQNIEFNYDRLPLLKQHPEK